MLQPISGEADCQTDYINASYIDVSVLTSTQRFLPSYSHLELLTLLQGYSVSSKFIASQGIIYCCKLVPIVSAHRQILGMASVVCV